MAGRPSARGFCAVAHFSLEIVEGVVVFHCTAVAAPTGRLIIYGPRSEKSDMAVTFAPDVREKIATALEKIIGKNHANSNDFAAA